MAEEDGRGVRDGQEPRLDGDEEVRDEYDRERNHDDGSGLPSVLDSRTSDRISATSHSPQSSSSPVEADNLYKTHNVL